MKYNLIKVGLFNLIIVALIGVLMRYKIGFEFPYLEQKNLQHGHSHFAFAGWVSHILYIGLTIFLCEKYPSKKSNTYIVLIYSNLICAYGMLITFILHGYGLYSIFFSTVSTITGIIFCIAYIKEVYSNRYDHPAIPWFIAGLGFNMLSSLGTISLGYMMGTHSFDQQVYLGSIYYYLHFQYSGWFFFACVGLFISKLYDLSMEKFNKTANKNAFYLFASATLPAYLLSMLWVHLPWYIYQFAIIAVILQLCGLYFLIKLILSNKKQMISHWPKEVNIMYSLAFVALALKLLLQAGSIFPEISKMAFGFRSIVIAYLHLVLLGFVSLFLLGYIIQLSGIKPKRTIATGLAVFSIGVFFNELFLAIQGIASFSYTLIPYLNLMLFAVSLVLLLGLLILIKGYSTKV